MSTRYGVVTPFTLRLVAALTSGKPQQRLWLRTATLLRLQSFASLTRRPPLNPSSL